MRAGDAELVLAGGAESASTAPWRFWPPDGDAEARPLHPRPVRPERLAGPGDGRGGGCRRRTASASPRQRQDDWAARSHELASAHRERGGFDARDRRDRRTAPATSGRGHRSTGPGWPGFGPAFTADGTVTAGNSCGISDGAAAMAVTTEAVRAELGLPGLRIVASATSRLRPGPARHRRRPRRSSASSPARALRHRELDAIEITEAFASQLLAVSDAVGLDEDRICADGGAIALGHPWGASGAVLLVRLAARMFASDDARYGLAACSIGGGQGIAMLVERAA